jgi:rubredoxin
MFDDFHASLHCPRCGHSSSSTEYLRMQTHIRGDADSSTLRVGFEFDPNDLRTDNISQAGFSLITAPSSARLIRLLNTWTCPACRTEQWAMVEIADGRLASIEAVQMDASTFKEANFIAEVDGELLAASMLGIPSLGLVEKNIDSVEVLRQRLPPPR